MPFKPCLKKCLIALFMMGAMACSKESDSPLNIDNITSRYNEINTCSTDSHTGTRFDFELELSNFENSSPKSVLIDYSFNYFTYGALLISDFTLTSSGLTCQVCFWFDYFNTITLNFRILTEDNKQSQIYTLTLEKPTGAN